MQVALLSLYLVLAFYRQDFLELVQEIDYPDFEANESKLETSHGLIALRDAGIFLLLTIVLFPLLLLPIVNVLIQLFLWAWLYRDANFRGTCALYCTKEEYETLRHHRFSIWSIAFFSSILNFIPIINIFTPFYAQLVAFHWIMAEKGLQTTPLSQEESQELEEIGKQEE